MADAADSLSAYCNQLPVPAGDPPAVFCEEARLLVFHRDRIERDVKELRAQCAIPGELGAAAIGYMGEIGSNIPDFTNRAAVKELARTKFRNLEAWSSAQYRLP
jgi:hypothetical protein